MTANFRSDNEAPVASEIMAAILEANIGPAHSYGEDCWTQRLNAEFGQLFERECWVWPLVTGTAANSLALAQICPPFGSIYCHEYSHLNTDECGAPEFYTAGAKLVGLSGAGARIGVETLRDALAKTGELGDHEVLPSALSLSQSTELGTLYAADHLRELSEVAHARQMRVHVDGARFANAVASLRCSPAELSWRVGVDLLSFGATKNGGMMAEALIVFDQDLAHQLGRRRKRAAHLLSKMRFISAQLLAYVEQGRWLRWAEAANGRAHALALGMEKAGLKLWLPTESNEVFVHLEQGLATRLEQAGCQFHHWPGTVDIYRFVCSWCTSEAEVEYLLKMI